MTLEGPSIAGRSLAMAAVLLYYLDDQRSDGLPTLRAAQDAGLLADFLGGCGLIAAVLADEAMRSEFHLHQLSISAAAAVGDSGPLVEALSVFTVAAAASQGRWDEIRLRAESPGGPQLAVAMSVACALAPQRRCSGLGGNDIADVLSAITWALKLRG